MAQATKQTIIVSGILEKDGKVLLARRPLTKKIAPGLYHLPGGHVEFGEHPEAALAREFEEEFQLNIEVDNLVRVFDYTNGDTHTVGLTYVVTARDIPDEIWFDPIDTAEIVWADAPDLDNLLKPDDHDHITLSEYRK